MSAKSSILCWSTVVIFAISGCAADDGSLFVSPEDVAFSQGAALGHADEVDVTPNDVTIEIGDVLQLSANVINKKGKSNSGRDVTWSSDNTSVAIVSEAGLVTAVAAGGPVTVRARTGGSKGVEGTAQITVVGAPGVQGWVMLAAPNAGPQEHAGQGVAYASDLNAVFFASLPDFFASTLWRFDLATDTWSQIAANNWPIGKYREILYDQPNGRLLTYWDGLGQVYSIPITGGSWAPVGASANSEEYYAGYSLMNPVSGRPVRFAGYGFGTFKDTWWEWDSPLNSWVAVTQGTPRPEARFGDGSSVAVDVAGSRAFFAHRSFGTAAGNGDDLWMIDLATMAWTNLVPANTGPDARLGSGLAYQSQGNTLFRFGGVTLYGGILNNQVQVLDLDSGPISWAVVLGIGTPPSARMAADLIFDAPRNRLVMVGGLDGTTWPGDVWAYYLPQ